MITLLGADTHFTMTGGKIVDNSVSSHYEPTPGWLPFEEVVYGTAISSLGGTVDIKNAEISGNQALGKFGAGAAICLFNGSLTINDSIVANNRSDWRGGGIYVEKPYDLTFYPITFGGGGGATTIPATPSFVNIKNSLIAFNVAKNAGADIVIEKKNQPPILPTVREMKDFAKNKGLSYDTKKLANWYSDAYSKRHRDDDPTEIVDISKPMDLPQFLIAAGSIQTYKITFDGAGASGTMAPVETTDNTYILPESTFTPPMNMQFSHWSVLGEKKIPGDVISLSADVVVRAVWEKKALPTKNDDAGNGFITIEKVENKGTLETRSAYLFGYPDGRIKPDGYMRRAEAIAIIARLEKLPLGATKDTPFSDTALNAWYNSAINASFSAGFIEEKPKDAFRPDDPITRGELAQLISHIPGPVKTQEMAPFEDIQNSPYKDAIKAGHAKGRIKGYPDRSFRPEKFITRAEVATIFNRIYGIKADTAFIAKHRDDMAQFKDLSKNHWAYNDLIAASTNHIISVQKGADHWMKTYK